MAKLEFTDQNFAKEVLNHPGVVLVDFWAPWCGPCQQQGPIIDELAEIEKYAQIKIGKMNIDENNETPSKYQIMSIPTILIFKNGEVEEQMVGVQQLEELEKKLNLLVK